uniref:Putative salivary lipocalin n=1 Tax=Ixodes ricinus TaxID=34613 RepID=A0A0K8RM65_IXORI
MEISVVVHILVLVFFLAVQVTGKCRKELFSQRLGRYPDAWRILGNLEQQFFLAYYSHSSETGSHLRCLRTIRRTEDVSVPWTTSLVYGYTSDNSTLLSGTVKVGIKKTNESYVFDDAFNTRYPEKVKEGEYIFKYDVSEIIYTNFKTCIVIYSELLGYQVWVAGKNPVGTSGLPYLCTFLYETCAGRKKNWAYDWTICPRIKSKDPKTVPNRRDSLKL